MYDFGIKEHSMGIAIRLLSVSLVLTLVATPAQGTTLTFDITYDLADLTDQWNSGGKYWVNGTNNPVFVPPFTVAPTDVLQTTVTFLPGQSIVVNDGETLWGAGIEHITIGWNNASGVYNSSTTTTQVTFFAPTGNLTLAGTPGSGLLSQNLFGNLTTSAFEFTGFTMTTTVLSSPTNTTYDRFNFWAVASGQTQLNTTAVPEHGSLPAVVAGLGSIFLARRRVNAPSARALTQLR
jgi:hypothetical protein